MRLDRVLVTMGSNYGDLDNDGWPDIYLGTGDPVLTSLMPNRMFRNGEGRFFQDVTTAGGFGHLQKGHGIAFGDIDNDGDQDVFAVLGGAYEGDTFQTALFENPGNTNHWLTLILHGTKSNRDALGARIELELVRPGGTRVVHGTVSSGGSFGANSLQQELGLGDAQAIRSIKIRWPLPDRPVQSLTNVPLDSVVRVREGSAGFELLPAKKFRLGPQRTPPKPLHGPAAR
jgi:hypothetical protein